jgi:hypothetical protein
VRAVAALLAGRGLERARERRRRELGGGVLRDREQAAGSPAGTWVHELSHDSKRPRLDTGRRRPIAPAAQEVVSLKDCSILAMIGKTVTLQLPGAFPSGAVMKMA